MTSHMMRTRSWNSRCGLMIGTLLTAMALGYPVIARADSDMYVVCAIDNQSGSLITMSGADTSWGRFSIPPASQINNGQTSGWKAEGASGSATGTTGEVNYTIADANSPSLIITFDIPYSGTGKIGAVLQGTGAGNYCLTCSGTAVENGSCTISTGHNGNSVTVTVSQATNGSCD